MGVSTLWHRCILRAGCYWNGILNQRPLLISSTEACDLVLATQANIWLLQSSANIFCRGQVVSLKDFVGHLHPLPGLTLPCQTATDHAVCVAGICFSYET